MLDIDAGIRVWRGGGICDEEAEHVCTINCDVTNYGPLRVNGADAGDVGRKRVVVARGTGTGRSEDRSGGSK